MTGNDGFMNTLRFLLLTMVLVLGLDIYFRADAGSVPVAAPAPQQVAAQEDSRLREDLNRALGLLEDFFGSPVQLDRIRSVPVTLTAYSSTVKQCDETPYVTASSQSVRIGIIAVSDDLMREMGLKFGQRVLIPGHGFFEVQDRMNPRWKRTVDIWVADRQAALLFGRQKGTLFWMPLPAEGMQAAQSTPLRSS